MRTVWHLSRWGLLGVLAVAALLLLSPNGGSRTAEATTSNPSLAVSLSSYAAGANADLTLTTAWPKGDSWPDRYIAFLPVDLDQADDSQLADGTIVGSFASAPTLSFLGSPCAALIPANFVFFDSTTVASGPTVGGSPTDSPTSLPAPAWTGFSDTDSDGLPEAVDNWPSFLDPFLDTFGLTTPTAIEAAMTARYHGQTAIPGPVPGALAVSLEFLVMVPGSVPGFPASLGNPVLSVLQDPSAPTGPSAVSANCTALSFSALTRGISVDNPCTPFNAAFGSLCSYLLSFGPLPAPGPIGGAPDESGLPVLTNPRAGNYPFNLANFSQRDAEGVCTFVAGDGNICPGDGIENELDTCPFLPNVGNAYKVSYGRVRSALPSPPFPPGNKNFFGNPASVGELFPAAVLGLGTASFLSSKVDVGDPDDDGIDAACDANPELPDLIVAEDLSVGTTCTDGVNNDFDFLSPTVGMIDAADSGCVDSDGDSISDKQDNCNIVANLAQTDSDGDSHGDACESSADAGIVCAIGYAQCFGSLLDVDGDFFTNQQDNCPQYPNFAASEGGLNSARQTEDAEVLNPSGIVAPASTTDGIGDPCDGAVTLDNPVGAGATGIPDGHYHINNLTVIVGIGHDVALQQISGPGQVEGPTTKTYTVRVRNNGGVTENIQVALSVAASGGCPAPSVSPSGPQSVTVASKAKGAVSFSVTFGDPAGACSPGNAIDYQLTADACHAGDASPGLFGVDPCPGTNDGSSDGNSNNDAPITKNVNDKTQ